MAPKKESAKGKKNRVAEAIAAAAPNEVANAQADRAGALFIGIDAGSKTEERYKNLSQTRTGASNIGAKTSFGPLGYAAYKTGSTLEQLAGYGPDDIYALQVRMHDAGLLDNFTPTQLDKTTRNAFKDLLATSNASMKTWQQTLDDITAVGGEIGKEKAPRKPPTVSLTSPEDIRSIANTAASTLIGNKMSDADLERFVQTYHQLETEAAMQDYNAQYAESPLTQVAPTTPKVVLENQLKTEHPNEYMATQFGAKMDQVIAKFTGGM